MFKRKKKKERIKILQLMYRWLLLNYYGIMYYVGKRLPKWGCHERKTGLFVNIIQVKGFIVLCNWTESIPLIIISTKNIGWVVKSRVFILPSRISNFYLCKGGLRVQYTVWWLDHAVLFIIILLIVLYYGYDIINLIWLFNINSIMVLYLFKY